MPNAFDRQVGGDHYQQFKIEPAEFNIRNKIPFAHGNVIKYLCRHIIRGNEEDLLKAIHYIDLIIACEDKDAQTSAKKTEAKKSGSRILGDDVVSSPPFKSKRIYNVCPKCQQETLGKGPQGKCYNCGHLASSMVPDPRRDNSESAE